MVSRDYLYISSPLTLILKLGRIKSRLKLRLQSWKEADFGRRLWDKDPTLWFKEPQPEIRDRLGWLNLPHVMEKKLDHFCSFAEEIKKRGMSKVLLCGMGGSSLAPEVFQKTLGNAPGYPSLLVLDSTHPQALKSTEEQVNLQNTLFLISSKSGTTLETLSFFRYFWRKLSRVTAHPGHHFVAITDPGSPLQEIAEKRNFSRVFLAPSDVGGRYSAFSDFGLVPASLIGMDVHRFLQRAYQALREHQPEVGVDKSIGFILGAALGEEGKSRDKLTFLTSPSLSYFSEWLEQLVAESTGKQGKGIVPVVREPPLPVQGYGKDRLFVYLSWAQEEREEEVKKVEELERKGHPVIHLRLNEKSGLAGEMYTWEVAVASAGAVLGIHPFNQPDVKLAKDLTKKAMEGKKEKTSMVAGEKETFSIEDSSRVEKNLKKWLEQRKERDYFTLQAFLNPSSPTPQLLQEIREKLLRKTQLATCSGFGPRFLHSTGQLHKGGPNNGLFLQLVDEPKNYLPVPETDYSFNDLIKAQSAGDYEALRQRKRRVLRLNLGKEAVSGLKNLLKLIKSL